MTKPSEAQINILAKAAKSPTTCITTFMAGIKNPAIKQRSINSMLGKGLIEKHSDIYIIAQAGFEAVGVKPKKQKSKAKPKANTKTESKPATKQDAINALLQREEGATLTELMNATGWQPHSIRGHLSNMRRKKQIEMDVTLNSEGKRVYQIIQEAA